MSKVASDDKIWAVPGGRADGQWSCTHFWSFSRKIRVGILALCLHSPPEPGHEEGFGAESLAKNGQGGNCREDTPCPLRPVIAGDTGQGRAGEGGGRHRPPLAPPPHGGNPADWTEMLTDAPESLRNNAWRVHSHAQHTCSWTKRNVKPGKGWLRRLPCFKEEANLVFNRHFLFHKKTFIASIPQSIPVSCL